PAAQPRLGPGRTTRAVRHLPPPRGVHRLTTADASGRGRAPRARRGRTSHRRPQKRTPGPPALGILLREQRLAGPGHHDLQPAARRRDPRLDLPRQSHHRDHPDPADQRDSPAGPLRATATTPPPTTLALADRLGKPPDHRMRTPPGHRPLTNTPPGTTKDTWKSRRPARQARSGPNTTLRNQEPTSNKQRRWIQA